MDTWLLSLADHIAKGPDPMKTWVVDLPDATETYEGYGKAKDGAFVIEDGRGVVLFIGGGAVVRREGTQPKSRTEKPKPQPPTSEDIAVAVGREVAKEVGKITRPDPPTDPTPVTPVDLKK